MASSSFRRSYDADRNAPARDSASLTPLLEWSLIVEGFAVFFFLLPHAFFGDDFYRFDDIEQLLHHGHVTSDKFSLVMPVFSAPFLLLGEVVRSPQWWALRFNVIVVAAGVLVCYRLLRGCIDPSLFRKAVLILLFASLLTNRFRDYYGEVFTATCIAVGIAALMTRRRAFGWSAIVVGVANTPVTIVPLAFVAAAEAARSRRLGRLFPLVVAAGLIMAENWIRRGGPVTTGYAGDHGVPVAMWPYTGRSGFSYPFVLGIASILFSFGRGLVFFIPGLLLGLARRTWRLLNELHYPVLLQLLFVGGLVLVYAKWWAWDGGISWGPRFFLFATVPASLLIGVRLLDAGRSPVADLVTLGVLTLSAWVGVMGAIADYSALGTCTENNYVYEPVCIYVPEYSSLWHPILQFPALTRSTATVAAFCALAFAYLAAPLVLSLARALRDLSVPRAWLEGWRL